MADYKDHKVVRELADLTYTMWNMGWDEKMAGTSAISCLTMK